MVVEFARCWDNGSWDIDYITMSKEYDTRDLDDMTLAIYLTEKGITFDSIDEVDKHFPGLMHISVFSVDSSDEAYSKLN